MTDQKETNEIPEIPVIVCGGANGRAVIFGWVTDMPHPETPVEIHRARMVLYWPRECGGLLGLSQRGPREGLRLTCSVPIVRDTCRQVLSVSDAAASGLATWPDA